MVHALGLLTARASEGVRVCAGTLMDNAELTHSQSHSTPAFSHLLLIPSPPHTHLTHSLSLSLRAVDRLTQTQNSIDDARSPPNPPLPPGSSSRLVLAAAHPHHVLDTRVPLPQGFVQADQPELSGDAGDSGSGPRGGI